MPKDGSKQIRWWPPTLCWLLKFSGLNDGYGELGSSLSGNWFACCLSTTIYILMKNSTIYMAQQLAAGQTLDDPLYSILSLMHFNQWRSYGHVHYMYSVNRKSVLKVDSGRYAWLSVSTRYPHALLWVLCNFFLHLTRACDGRLWRSWPNFNSGFMYQHSSLLSRLPPPRPVPCQWYRPDAKTGCWQIVAAARHLSLTGVSVARFMEKFGQNM